MLAVAAIWQLTPSERHRVQLLTYSSPPERLYGRLFPAFFGQQQLWALRHEVHRWRNLWRAADPVGGPVFPRARPDCSEVGAQLQDPLAFGRSVEQPLSAPIRGHDGYSADPVFALEHEHTTASAFWIVVLSAAGTFGRKRSQPALTLVFGPVSLPLQPRPGASSRCRRAGSTAETTPGRRPRAVLNAPYLPLPHHPHASAVRGSRPPEWCMLCGPRGRCGCR